MNPGPRDIVYLALPDAVRPYLLARVRWPDVAQAVTVECAVWQEDPGLFDLPYHPYSVRLTHDEAADIARTWGVDIADDGAAPEPGPLVIRRMPSNWGMLAPAERRAWGLDLAVLTSSAGPRSAGLGARWAGRARAGRGLADAISRLRRRRATPDRRGDERIRIAGLAHLSVCDVNLSASVLDISRRGLHCFALDMPADAQSGERVRTALALEQLNGSEQIDLESDAAIIWRRDVDGGSHFGVAFEVHDSEQAERIHGLLAVAASGPTF
jgi:hypothetical protein